MQGRTIVVTGGFGSLGAQVAEAAAKRGAAVAALDHAKAPPTGLAERLGDRALLLGGVDLASGEAASQAMAQIKAKLGKIDALVNIAGGFRWETVEKGDVATWDFMYAINLKTVFNASQSGDPLSLGKRLGPHCQCRRRPGHQGRRRRGRICRQQGGRA